MNELTMNASRKTSVSILKAPRDYLHHITLEEKVAFCFLCQNVDILIGQGINCLKDQDRAI